MTATRHEFRLTRAQLQVLLLLAILVVTVGLILTGVARLRQSAAQMQCGNNLRQLGIGVQSYQDANTRLPPLVDQGEGSRAGRGLPSMYWELIPFLESTWRLYYPDGSDKSSAERYHAHSSTSFTFQAKMETVTQHGGDVNHPWRTFLCPSDTAADKLRDVPVTLPDGSIGYYATGNYAANGLFPWNAKDTRVNSASTILFAERPQVCRIATGETVHNLWGVGFYSPQMPAFATLTPEKPAGLWSTGQIAPGLPLPDHEGEVRVRIGWANAEPQVPDFVTPIQQMRRDRPCDPRLPGSMHADGMMAAMADGSARVFRYDTTPWVFWAACVPTEKK